MKKKIDFVNSIQIRYNFTIILNMPITQTITLTYATDYVSLNYFIEGIITIMNKSLMNCFPKRDWNEKTRDQIQQVLITRRKTILAIKEWRHFQADYGESEVEPTDTQIENSILYKELQAHITNPDLDDEDKLLIHRTYKSLADYEWYGVNEGEILDCFGGMDTVEEMSERHSHTLTNYHRNSIKNLIKGKNIPREDYYAIDILDYANYMLEVKSANKIGKFFLKNYYSPYTAIGKRRFNRELDKLEQN